MKTIGVLGGIGAQATMAFVERVHEYSQRLIPPNINAGYPPLVVYYCRFPPVLLDQTGEPRWPLEPDPRFLEAARWLGDQADFLIIPANAAHQLQDHVETASGKAVLSIIDLALQEVEGRGWKKVGLLGLGKPTVYTEPLDERATDYLLIPAKLQEALDQAIFRVMEGRQGGEEKAVARRAVDHLRQAGPDGILLGCTELPFLLPDATDQSDLLDPGDLLAQAAVKEAIG